MKTNKLVAATAFGIAFLNASISVNAEELSNAEELLDAETATAKQDGFDMEDSAEQNDTHAKEESSEPTGSATFEEAEENLEKAKETEIQAKEELANARQETDNAQTDVDKAQSDMQEAEDALNQAKTEKDAAEAEKDRAEAEASEAEQAVGEAEGSLDKALENAGVDEEEYYAAQKELEEKAAEVEQAEKAAAEAAAENADKKTAEEAAEAEVEELKIAVDSAQAEKETADQTVSDAQNTVDEANQEYEDALHAAEATVDTARQSLEEKASALEAVQKKIASGSLGFFKHMAESEDADSAKAAVEILTSSDGTGVSGLANKDNWAAESWEQFISYTHIGDKEDATDLESMRRAIEYIKQCNELRVGDELFPGREELKINDAMMAIAQLNANWAVYVGSGNSNTHAEVFDTGENLAYYLNNYEYDPYHSDPFNGWYYEEKAQYMEGERDGNKVGHYYNIVENQYAATGFGVNLREYEDDTGFVWPRLNCTQEFLQQSLIDRYGYGQSYSVSEYEARFNAYCNAVTDELSRAQAAYDAACAAYEKALADLEEGELIASKKAELDNAADALEAAKNDAAEKLGALSVLQAAYDDGTKKYAAAQTAYAQSSLALQAAENSLQQKQDAYKEISDRVEAYGTEITAAEERLTEARNAYAEATKALANAKTELTKAKEKLDAAENAKSAAGEKLSEKTDVLAQKQEALKKAQDAYYLAAAELAIAEADYERLKPQIKEEKSNPSYVQERVYDMGNDITDTQTVGRVFVEYFANGKKITFAKNCSFRYFLDTSADFIENTHNALTIDCSSLPWFSLNKKTLEALRENPDISLTFIFSYKGKQYMFTIPAGTDLNLLQDSEGWYGFMYLKMMFGGDELV